MITPDFARTMARYNSWQNKSLYDAADGLDPAERKRDRGAFFGSIEATLNHLLWADHVWMSRFDDWVAPRAKLAASGGWVAEWADLKAKRRITDARILRWANGLSAADLEGEVSWYSGAAEREISQPKALLVQHFFNHQTHHRGQVHAMLTAAGAKPDPTDLFLMPAG